MKILLAYSKAHFNPQLPKSKHSYWGSSANILARALYNQLGELGEITYIDAWEAEDLASIAGQKFDVFVGIIYGFEKIVGAIECPKKILFAVNSHPDFRNNQLTSFLSSKNLSSKALNDWDLADESLQNGVKLADYIIGVGDNVTFNSFVEAGLDKRHVKFINYGVGPVQKSLSKAKPNRFVYVSSDIGLRKGFDIVTNIFSHPALANKDFHLDIVGTAETDYYKKKITVLKELLGNKLTVHGWLDSQSKEYSKVLSESAFLVYPALEEGQAGTILDSLRYGVIPITSAYTGVPFSPLGQLETSLDSDTNVALILEAIATKPTALTSLRSHAQEYYQEFHEDFEPNLSSTLQQVIKDGNLYPKISLVLPIFNKQDTIEDLLVNLYRSCELYGNTELHIIFDGCKDKTEKIVRKFFKNKPHYPVSYETTADIFEVKTNNIGLRKSTGKYAAIIQDDNFIYDRDLFFEIAMLMDNDSKITILGGLAGVNFYPRGTKNLSGSGQIAMNDNEAYWRQDEKTNPNFKHQYYEVDACMRGPLVFRKSFLDEHGYLDEAYAPFYMDDMDICFRAKKFGYHVYTALFNVVNMSATVATYNTAERKKFWEDAMKRTSDLFYSRWKPGVVKDYNWIHRQPVVQTPADKQQEEAFRQANQLRNEARERRSKKRVKLLAPAGKVKRGVYGAARRIKRKISA